MSHYYLAHDPSLFEAVFVASLKQAWAEQSFRPIQQAVRPELIQSFVDWFQLKGDDLMLTRLGEGIAFDHDMWETIAGEMLFALSEELRQIQDSRETLLALQSEKEMVQVHEGTDLLAIGRKTYRPAHAGVNSVADVQRLNEYLQGVDADRWSLAVLAVTVQHESPEDLVDELAYAKQGLEQLQELYERAASAGRLIVCETV